MVIRCVASSSVHCHVAGLSRGGLGRGGLSERGTTADIRETDVPVPLDAGKMAVCSTGCHCSVCGGSGHCSSTLDVSLGQKKTGRRVKLLGVVSCWLIVSAGICRGMSCMRLLAQSPFFFFFRKRHTSYLHAFGMFEVHLKENWRKSPSWYQNSWGGRDWEERGPVSWQLMRHPA